MGKRENTIIDIIMSKLDPQAIFSITVFSVTDREVGQCVREAMATLTKKQLDSLLFMLREQEELFDWSIPKKRFKNSRGSK